MEVYQIWKEQTYCNAKQYPVSGTEYQGLN